MNAATTVAIVNTAIVLTVAIISSIGLFLGTADGLWSILLMFFFMSTSRGDKK